MLPPYFPPVSRQTAQLINRQGLLFVFNAFRGPGLGFHPHQSLLRGHLPFFVHSRLSPFPVLCMLSPNVLFSSSQFIFNLLLYYYIQIFLKCKPFYNNGRLVIGFYKFSFKKMGYPCKTQHRSTADLKQAALLSQQKPHHAKAKRDRRERRYLRALFVSKPLLLKKRRLFQVNGLYKKAVRGLKNTRFAIKMHTAGVAFYQERVFLIHGQRQFSSNHQYPLTVFSV